MKLTKHILLLTLAVTGLAACNEDDDDVYIPPAAYALYGEVFQEDWTPYDNNPEINSGYTATFDLQDLTAAIHDEGAVLVYISYGEDVYEALPQVYDGISYSFTTSPESLTIEVQSVDGLALANPGDISLKIVLIEGVALKAHPNIDLKSMSLNEVEKTFGVQAR